MMKQFERFFQDHFDNFKMIPFSGVTFSSEVRKLCEQNSCGNLGKSWTCPPAVAPPGELKNQLSRFHRVIIVNKVYPLEDSFDWEGWR